MTKKHFISLANIIKANPHAFPAETLYVLACWCAQQNPHFNWDRWFSYIRGECGPCGGKIKGNA